jgi:cell division inhibitor SulA/protein ImuA
MRAAMALLPLFPDHDITPPADAAPVHRGTPAPRSIRAEPPGTDIKSSQRKAAIEPISAAHAATLQQLAGLWRADEIAHATCRDATISTGFAALDAELPGGGWPKGQLIELLFDASGIGELSLLAPALAGCAREARACVWVLPPERAAASLPTLPYPPALAAAGIDLARALFVQPETPRETFWAIEQSLRATHLGALLGWLPHAPSSRDGEFRALRRLQLLASHRQALVFLLREARALQAPSPAALRLQLTANDDELAVAILKRRGRPLLEPVMLQIHPAHWNRSRGVAVSNDTPIPSPQPAGRLAQAALAARRWSARMILSH